MKLFKDEKAVSEVVGAMMILLILVLYLGIMQTRQVPEWNKELEKQQFDSVYDDFVTLRSNMEDVSAKSIPKTSNFHMGVRYPERFMLSNPGPGANGILSTYPLMINISYDTTKGTEWKNYTSMGIIYYQDGISDSPRLIYENGLMMKDYGNGIVIAVDDSQSITSKDNIFIPILYGDVESSSSMEIESMNIAPIPNEGFSQEKFVSMNATVQTRYPRIWTDISKQSRPDGSNFTIGNGTNCNYGNSNDSCLKLTNIPGNNVKRLNLPDNDIQSSWNQIYVGMVTFDNSLLNFNNSFLNSRGPTGPDGQDISEKNQGRLDIPSNLAQFIIRDIAFASGGDKEAILKYSVKDSRNKEWLVEIQFDLSNVKSPKIDYIKQKEPKEITYNFFTGKTLAELEGQIDLTTYFNTIGIGSPNKLTVDGISSEILYVNFLIN